MQGLTIGMAHTAASLLAMSISKSAGQVFLYDSYGVLLDSFTSATLLAKVVGSTHSVIMSHIKGGKLWLIF